jgi:hypothetical protein
MWAPGGLQPLPPNIWMICSFMELNKP